MLMNNKIGTLKLNQKGPYLDTKGRRRDGRVVACERGGRVVPDDARGTVLEREMSPRANPSPGLVDSSGSGERQDASKGVRGEVSREVV